MQRLWFGLFLASLTTRCNSVGARPSMRLTWPDGTSVELYFIVKGPAKSQVAVQHVKLADKASADRMKAFWAERLGALEAIIAPRGR